MRLQKSIKYTLLSIMALSVFSILYAKSFDNVESVCKDYKSAEVYLLNYVTKKDLKNIVYTHNADFKFQGDEATRIYLLNDIFEIPDPLFDNKIDYRKKGCELIDNMNIYCEVRYRKLKDGKINVWYNFME